MVTWPKTVYSKAVLQDIEINRVSISRTVSGKRGISQSCEFCYLHDQGKSIYSYWIVPHVTKNIAKLLTRPSSILFMHIFQFETVVYQIIFVYN